MSGQLAARRPGRLDRPLSYLPRPLTEARRPLLAIATGWAAAFIPSIALAAMLSLLLPEARAPEFPFTGATALFLLVVFAPVVETAIMGTVLLILLRFVSPTVAVLVSAVGWGAAHSLEAPIWGLVIWWPFLIFSTLFVSWRDRSVAAAFTIPAVVHGLHNLLPALPIAYPGLI